MDLSMATPERPLSPHLQIYRWQITMVMSILHRLTGVFLAFGAFAMALVLLELSGTPPYRHEGPPYRGILALTYQGLVYVLDSPVGMILILAFAWSLIYHLLNGIRHLFWDAGKGFEIKQFTTSGWVVVVLSFVLTAVLVMLPWLLGRVS
jgi:succinate dehydrogenase / fumarate reductase cytochrome b subunit